MLYMVHASYTNGVYTYVGISQNVSNIYVSMYLCMDVSMYVCMDAWMYGCMIVCMYACMHPCMYACMHVCMYICTYVCVYYIYMEISSNIYVSLL